MALKGKQIELPFLRTTFNYDMNAAGDESGLNCQDPSLTKQSMKDECDINFLVKRYEAAGQIPAPLRVPQYGDFLEVKDFTSAMQAVVEARESFMAMPAELRARFHNDPQELLEFVAVPENAAEAVKIGLAVPPVPPKEPEPMAVRVVNPQGDSEPKDTPPKGGKRGGETSSPT